MNQIGQKGRRYAADKYLTYKSALIFTFDLEIWFKVTAHAFLKCYVCVKHEPSRAKWRVYKTLTFDLDTWFKITAYPLPENTMS